MCDYASEVADSRALRRGMVDTLARDGPLRSTRVAEALLSVPRELFVPGVPLDEVYRTSEPIIIKRVAERNLSSASAPDVMAAMLEQLEPRPGQHVLEIGAGSGYNAALLAHLVGPDGHVTTIDIDTDLVEQAREHLQAAGVSNVEVIEADGALGYAPNAPYERIMLTVASHDLAPAWREQLAHGDARIVLPLSFGGMQRSVAFEQRVDHLASRSVGPCMFIALRGMLEADEQPAPDQISVLLRLIDPNSTEPSLPAEILRAVNDGAARVWRSGVEVGAGYASDGLLVWLAAREPQLAGLGVAWSEQYGPRGEVCVVALTSASALAERLVAHVQAWAAAERPGGRDLRLRAYAREQDYQPRAGEVVVERRWTRFVLTWAPAST
jgi:protein-L-isoaspartate(D-aspartate) O-methyltransferase